jgi:hypothetical protein
MGPSPVNLHTLAVDRVAGFRVDRHPSIQRSGRRDSADGIFPSHAFRQDRLLQADSQE